jgi:hypothetical protein
MGTSITDIETLMQLSTRLRNAVYHYKMIYNSGKFQVINTDAGRAIFSTSSLPRLIAYIEKVEKRSEIVKKYAVEN